EPGSVFIAYGYQPGEPVAGGATYFSYGYNGYGVGGNIGSVRDGSHKGLGWIVGKTRPGSDDELPASRVRVPEDMIAIADGVADGKVDGAIVPFGDSVKYMWPGNVHSGGANVLFCDGHVQWFP